MNVFLIFFPLMRIHRISLTFVKFILSNGKLYAVMNLKIWCTLMSEMSVVDLVGFTCGAAPFPLT